MNTKLPTVAQVAAALREAKRYLDRRCREDINVRLQVYETLGWALRTGDPSYDLDHRGFWGCSTLDRRSNCRLLAKELLEQVRDHAAQ